MKRQIIYQVRRRLKKTDKTDSQQNYYFCARSVDGVEKRVPCLPEDKATAEAEIKRWILME
jgi:hypothetical protein